jgi:hypothetical protein
MTRTEAITFFAAHWPSRRETLAEGERTALATDRGAVEFIAEAPPGCYD